MTFNEMYTTNDKKAAEPEKEKDKVEVSNDAFAIAGLLESLVFKLEQLRLSK